MTLNKDALVHIGEQAINAARGFQVEAPPHTIVLPSTHEIHDLHHLEPLKRRFTGTLKTNSLADFINYTKEHSDNTQGFIDPRNLSCTSFFNLGDVAAPGHADWKAHLTLVKTVPYDALLHVNGRHHDQRELTDWLEDWADSITPYAVDQNEAYGPLSKAIQAIRKITIKASSEGESTVGDFGASRTALEQIEASSKLELPGGFYFTCEPYLGLPERRFRVRLQVLTGGRDPVLVLRVIQLEAQQDEIANDFKAALLRELEGKARLTIGTFAA